MYKNIRGADLKGLIGRINIIDIRKNYFDVSFFMSEWCFDLCSIAGIVYSLYFKKAMEEGHKLKDPLHVVDLAYRL